MLSQLSYAPPRRTVIYSAFIIIALIGAFVKGFFLFCKKRVRIMSDCDEYLWNRAGKYADQRLFRLLIPTARGAGC